MPPRAGRCPGCGEPVTPFAAGCAICGHDLDGHRRRQAERRRAPAVRLPTVGPLFATPAAQDVALIALLVLTALLAPFVCLFFAIFGARDRDRQGRIAARNAMLVVGAVALASLLIPELRFGLFSLLWS
jgi:hypothetical protein